MAKKFLDIHLPKREGKRKGENEKEQRAEVLDYSEPTAWAKEETRLGGFANEKGFNAREEMFLREVAESAQRDSFFPIVRSAAQNWKIAKIFLAFISLFLVAAGIYYAGFAIASVNINVKLVQSTQEDVFPFIFQKKARVDSSEKNVLAYQEARKTFSYTQSYQSTGEGIVTGYAKGMIKIFNEYSPTNLNFVVRTRFETADGKIFRTQSPVTIPGYTVRAGKLQPGIVVVAIQADQPGPEYNIASNTVLKVSAFQGTDRYDKIYAVLQDSLKGGVKGKAAVITEDDMKNAKEKIVEYAFNQAKAEMFVSLPEGKRLLDKALQLKINKISSVFAVNDAVDKFDVTIDGELRIWFFDENQIRQLVASKLTSPDIKNELVNSEIQLFYENVNVSFEEGKISMNVRVKQVLRPVLDITVFKQRIAGQDIDTLKRELLKLGGVERANISVWPFWVNLVPKNIDRIRINIE